MAHCLQQTAEWHGVLKNVDVTTSSGVLRGQPETVRAALQPLYATHNGGSSFACFNLKALNAEVNVKKGAVYKALLAKEMETKGDFRAVYDVRQSLLKSLAKASACAGDSEATGRVSDALLSELQGTSDVYVERLSAGLPPGPLTARSAGAVSRANSSALALAETVKELAARILDE